MSNDGYAATYNGHARLIILKALAEQTDYRLNDSLLAGELSAHGINKGRSFVKTHLNWLESQVAAVTQKKVGTSVIAQITEAGLDHVEMRQVLDDVARPSPKG